jgi:hypothetical protein
MMEMQRVEPVIKPCRGADAAVNALHESCKLIGGSIFVAVTLGSGNLPSGDNVIDALRATAIYLSLLFAVAIGAGVMLAISRETKYSARHKR